MQMMICKARKKKTHSVTGVGVNVSAVKNEN